MVTASCSVNKDEVKELSASGEFKGGAINFARLEALRDNGRSDTVAVLRSESGQTLQGVRGEARKCVIWM